MVATEALRANRTTKNHFTGKGSLAEITRLTTLLTDGFVFKARPCAARAERGT